MANSELGEVIQRTFQVGETFFWKVSSRENRHGDGRIWFHFRYRTIGLSIRDAQELMETLFEINEPVPAKLIEDALSTAHAARDRNLRRLSAPPS